MRRIWFLTGIVFSIFAMPMGNEIAKVIRDDPEGMRAPAIAGAVLTLIALAGTIYWIAAMVRTKTIESKVPKDLDIASIWATLSFTASSVIFGAVVDAPLSFDSGWKWLLIILVAFVPWIQIFRGSYIEIEESLRNPR